MQHINSNLNNDRNLTYFKNSSILEWKMLDTSTKYIKVENKKLIQQMEYK